MSDPSSLSPATGQRQFLTIPGASSPPAPEPSNSPAFRIPALDRGFIVAKKRQLECNWDMFNTIVAKYDAARDGHAKHVAGFEHDIPIQDSSNADTYAGAMEGAKEAECGCIKMAELIDTYGFLLQRPKDPRMKPDAMLWVEDYRNMYVFTLSTEVLLAKLAELQAKIYTRIEGEVAAAARSANEKEERERKWRQEKIEIQGKSEEELKAIRIREVRDNMKKAVERRMQKSGEASGGKGI